MSVVIAIGDGDSIVVLYHVSIPVVIQVVTSITTVGNKCSMVKPIAKLQNFIDKMEYKVTNKYG